MWEKKKIGDIVDIRRGASPRPIQEFLSPTGMPWVKIADATADHTRFITKTNECIIEDGVRHSVIVNPETLIVSNSATPGLPKIMKITACVHDGWLVFDNYRGVLRDYLYYKFIDIRRMLVNHANGSVFQNLKTDIVREFDIMLPPIETQQRIVAILSALDTKIETNDAINDILLQQAQNLFNSWFIDFEPFDELMVKSPAGYDIPESLKMIQIQDIPHILETGKRPKGGAVSEGIPSIGAENVKNLGVFDSSSAKYIPYEFASSMKKGQINGYELLIYKDGGKPGTFIPHFSMFGEGFPYKEEFYINEHVFKLDFYDRGYNEFAYLYMLTDYPYHWLANNGGKAAIPGINQHDVNSIWIYPPSHPKVQEFCEWVKPIFTTVLTNCAQNMKLAKLRDAFLPKLMSGEIDVSDMDL